MACRDSVSAAGARAPGGSSTGQRARHRGNETRGVCSRARIAPCTRGPRAGRRSAHLFGQEQPIVRTVVRLRRLCPGRPPLPRAMPQRGRPRPPYSCCSARTVHKGVGTPSSVARRTLPMWRVVVAHLPRDTPRYLRREPSPARRRSATRFTSLGCGRDSGSPPQAGDVRDDEARTKGRRGTSRRRAYVWEAWWHFACSSLLAS
jgi:hypothetical protein